ncbi:MAG TPA: PEP-CTERM sorting domain-containing protein, partial [Candidatus Udaeobacter sp.]|nr:PEP-CTERM sorting domain-containing protein [Candidatus Udaeobacter sp.]
NTPIPTSIGTIVLNNTLNVGGTLGVPNLLIRLHFTNGQSNGNDLQNVIDNIQVNGVIVPEPATVAGGLLGVLGLCWFQRRRLISAVRFRRA